MKTAAKSKTSKGNQRQSMIVQAARILLLRDGYASFTMRDVAALADMSLGNLQYYYPARDELVAAVIEDELEASFAIIGEVDWQTADRDTVVRSLTHALLTRLGGPSGKLYLIMAFLSQSNEQFQHLVDEIYDRTFMIVTAATKMAAPHLDENTLPAAAELVVALFDGAIARIHAQPHKFQDAGLALYADIIADGLLRLLGYTD